MDVGGKTVRQAARTLERRSAELAVGAGDLPASARIRGSSSPGASASRWTGAPRSTRSAARAKASALCAAFAASTCASSARTSRRRRRRTTPRSGRSSTRSNRRERPAPRGGDRAHGLTPQIVPSRTGHVLDRQAAAATIVRALASLKREPVGLPIEVDTPKVKADDLTVPQAQVRAALSSSVHLTLGATRWNLRPPRIARILNCPPTGGASFEIGGAGASAWFTALAKRVDRPPTDADWAISSKARPCHPGPPGLRARRSAQRKRRVAGRTRDRARRCARRS